MHPVFVNIHMKSTQLLDLTSATKVVVLTSKVISRALVAIKSLKITKLYMRQRKKDKLLESLSVKTIYLLLRILKFKRPL